MEPEASCVLCGSSLFFRHGCNNCRVAFNSVVAFDATPLTARRGEPQPFEPTADIRAGDCAAQLQLS